MKITPAIKQSIESRFGEGQLFTILDFSELDKTYRRGHIRSTLSMLSGVKCGYLTIVGKVKGVGNMPPVNQYKLTKPVTRVEEVEIPAGTITKRHSMDNRPVRPGRYGVVMWDRTEAERIWRDGMWWHDNGKSLAACFVMEWWGVTR